MVSGSSPGRNHRTRISKLEKTERDSQAWIALDVTEGAEEQKSGIHEETVDDREPLKKREDPGSEVRHG